MAGLADFIRSNEEAIVAEWEAFARDYVPSAKGMDRAALRDDIGGLLQFLADDLDSVQTERQRNEKSKGQGPKAEGALDSSAEVHAAIRFTDGFSTPELISEFRALRASVLKLWVAAGPRSEDSFEGMTRLNEAIDQITAESVLRFTEKLDLSANLFMGILVHDFRSPLSAVYHCVQALLLKGNLDAEQVELAHQMESSTSRLNQLVSDLIDNFRIRLDQGLPIETASMDIGTAVAQAAEEVRLCHPDRKIVVETSGDLVGEWDSARMGQVASNLIGNAVQHGEKTAAIDVTVHGEGPEVILSVHNAGAIPADSVANIFEPLRRGEADRPQATNSLGLGLFIARGIVAAHGGELNVTSSEEGGTTFRAHLPRHPLKQRIEDRNISHTGATHQGG